MDQQTLLLLHRVPAKKVTAVQEICMFNFKMAGPTVRFLLENNLCRSLKFITRMGYNFNLVSPRITHNASHLPMKKTRFISSKSYLAKDRVDSTVSTDLNSRSQMKKEKDRSDLKRIKELLFQENSDATKSHTYIHKVDELVKPQVKQKKPRSKAKAAVNITLITDILSALKPSKGHSSDNSPTLIKENAAQIDYTVEPDKVRDALSTLVQDSSKADEITMTDHQISSDNKSDIERFYNMKQQQSKDKNKRKKMARSSLKTGPRFHMFDKVRVKWSGEHGDVDKTIFQEMAEQEVKDLGMSATVQSGFHDLMDNIHRQWSFPVDNEIYKTEENVGFDEHVFLEHLLDDFPQTGNIQQFMELVVTGLQQNPHLTVQEKKEHIEWFREYFQNIPDERVQL